MANSTPHQPFYNYEWCYGVVLTFWERMGRGPYNLAKFSGISTHDLFQMGLRFLQQNPLRWRIWKAAIKFADGCDDEMIAELAREKEVPYLTSVRRFCQEMAFESLQAEEKSPRGVRRY